MSCPCGSGTAYPDCCGALHRGAREAVTAEQLMRARYSAFAVGEVGYLLGTHADSTRPDDLTLPHDITWTRLRILDVVAGGPDDATGVVEFRAHFRRHGEPETLQERSHFTRDRDHRWTYVTAE